VGKSNLLLLLFLPVLAIGSWKFFESDSMVNLILFDQEWSEYPEYYAYDTSLYLSFSIFTFIIWQLCKELYDKSIVKITKFYFILSLIRLLDYWLFHDLFDGATYMLVSLTVCLVYLTKADLWMANKLKQWQSSFYR